jgi:hypothetical protein
MNEKIGILLSAGIGFLTVVKRQPNVYHLRDKVK